jgi:hypothetical protein
MIEGLSSNMSILVFVYMGLISYTRANVIYHAKTQLKLE